MTTSQQRYQQHLASEYWSKVSQAVKKRADYRCQVCNSQHDLEAHHRTYEHRGNELEHLNDLTCLCRRCHGVFHKGDVQPSPQVVERVIERVQVHKETREEFKARIAQRRIYEDAVVRAELRSAHQLKVGHDGLTKKQRRLIRREERAKAREVIESKDPIAAKYPGRVCVEDISDPAIDALMPPGDSETLTLTEELIAKCRLNSAFTTAATVALGVTDLTQGWPARLVGTTIPRAQYRKALIGARLYSKQGARGQAWRAALAPSATPTAQ